MSISSLLVALPILLLVDLPDTTSGWTSGTTSGYTSGTTSGCFSGTTSGCSSGHYFRLLLWVLFPAALLVLFLVPFPGTTSK